MDTLKNFFPLSFKAINSNECFKVILTYIVASIVCGIVIKLLSWIPLAGVFFELLGTVIGFYFFVGIILAILNYFKILK